MLQAPFDFASGALMLAYVVVAVIYCLAALHAERSDRSILFWKSLPVSNVTTVLAKASIPVLLLPLVTFAIIVVTHIIMLLAGSAVLAGRGIPVAALWAQIPLLPMWAAMLYHLVTVHALYWAPFYGWLLLASAWARRAAFLWAAVPLAAVLIIEKLVFDTSIFAHMLLSQLGGGPAAIPFPPHGNMPMQAPTLADLEALLASPGLWIRLAVFAALLAAAALAREGLEVIRLPAKSPNLNAFAERFVRSIKAECLSRMIFFGLDSLRHAISEYMKHYHSERNHQGIGNRLLQPPAERAGGPLVKRRARLGGMLSYYYRQAA